MKRTIRFIFSLQLILLYFLCPATVSAENIDPANEGYHYAWGENTGWINFKPSQGTGITVNDMEITGYAWAENIGWINFNPASGGVHNNGYGNLSGYAWGENVGWINFAPTGGGVTIDPVTGIFTGYAWGENIGWINLAPINGGLKTSWRPLINEPPIASDQNLTTPENTSVSILLTATDSDEDPLTFIIHSFPSQGTLSGTAPDITYSPNADYVGMDSFTFTVNDGKTNSNVATISIVITPQAELYNFEGFFSPINNLPVLNNAKAGQAVPVKWRLTDGNGMPIADPASFTSFTSYIISCDSLSDTSTNAVDEYATGSSGLQYLENGNWQFNWKTSKAYAGQCRTIILNLSDGSSYNANFQFK